MKKLLLFLYLFAFSFHFSQSLISGKVISESNAPIPNVLVLNMRTEEKSISNSQGEFQISAQKGDEIRLIKKGYERNSIRIDAILEEKNIILKNAMIVIEEVEINKFKPTGNLKKDSKTLNKSEKVTMLNSELLSNSKKPYTQALPKAVIPREFSNGIVGGGFTIGGVKFLWDKIDLVKNIKQALGKEYFLSMDIKEEQVDHFINFCLDRTTITKNLKYGYFDDEDLGKFKVLFEKNIHIYLKK